MLKKRDLSPLLSKEMGELEKKGTALAAQVIAEGAVLLENKGILPLEPQPVGLYGYGARLTMVRGIGSGDVTYRYTVNFESGLENAGFTVVSKKWLDEFDKLYADYRKELLEDVARETEETGVDNLHVLYGRPHILPDSQDIKEEDIRESGADLAIYVISRKEGEGLDNRYVRGEYLPSEQELKQIRTLRKGFEKLIVVLNSGTSLELKEILAIGPDAVLQMWQGGAEAGNVFAGLLTGKYNPSGKLTSTWSVDYFDHPTSREYGLNDGNVKEEVYKEGVYLGYRYFDSFNVKPLYPFGYGMSYTTFRIESAGLSSLGSKIMLKARVTNTGNCPGKEVAQLYMSSPLIGIDKPYQQLVGFGKTRELKPGETEELELQFRLEDFPVFCDEKNAYLLEKGDYILRLGNSSRNTRTVGVVRLTGERIIKKVRRLFGSSDWVETLKAPTMVYDTLELAELSKVPHVEMDLEAIPSAGMVEYSGEPINYFNGSIDPADVNLGGGSTVYLEAPDDITLEDVKNGVYSMEQLAASLSIEELVRLCMGEEFYDPRFVMCNNGSYHVPGAAGETTNWFLNHKPERKIPYAIMADGPAGLRLIVRIQQDEHGDIPVVNPLLTFEGGEFATGDDGYFDNLPDFWQYVTGLPISAQLSSTWNLPLLYEVGRIVGAEMVRYDVNLWLAPGLNLYRNPICGRNFEYFSEDPWVSAACSIALTRGVQSYPGRGTTIKHLAVNNQETARTSQNSIVNERTMRELYLRGFELTVKYGNPQAIMTSLNCVNGPHGTNSRELATYIAKDEWNFKGLVMTDWNTTTPARGGSTVGVINAGDDIIMPGSKRDVEKLTKAVSNLTAEGDFIAIGALQNSAMGVLRYLLKTGRI